MAIVVRYAFTPNEPILLPADVKRIELPVQRHEVSIAAVSPTRLESKLLTDKLQQNNPDDLKSFHRKRGFARAATVRYRTQQTGETEEVGTQVN
jgi:hypothetical protein